MVQTRRHETNYQILPKPTKSIPTLTSFQVSRDTFSGRKVNIKTENDSMALVQFNLIFNH